MRTLKGIFLVVCGLVVLVIAQGLKVQARESKDFGIVLLMIPVFIFGIWFSRKLLRRSRKQFVPFASEATSRDTRKPILLLRSFQDDERIVISNSLWDPRNLLIGRGRNFEEVLVKILDRFGPVVAIGRPGESAPPSGAFRMYVPHDRWKEEVVESIRSSQLIIVQLGATSGLSWEIEQLFRLGAMDKVVIALPPQSEDELWLRWQFFSDVIEEATSLHCSGFPPEDALFAYLGSQATFRFVRLPKFSRNFFQRTFTNQWRFYAQALELLVTTSRVSRDIDVGPTQRPTTQQIFQTSASAAASSKQQWPLASIPRRVAAAMIDMAVIFVAFYCHEALSPNRASKPTGEQNVAEVFTEQFDGSQSSPPGTLLAQSETESTTDEDPIPAIIVFAWMSVIALCEWRYGHSPGKYCLGLKVVNRFGRKLSLGQSLGRNFLKYMCCLMPISLAMLFLNELRQCLHDLLARTLVVSNLPTASNSLPLATTAKPTSAGS